MDPSDLPYFIERWSIFDELSHCNGIKYFYVFGNDRERAGFVINRYDVVFGIGYNGPNRLLCVDNYTEDSFVNVYALSGKGVNHISVGETVGGAVTNKGHLYYWGQCYKEDDSQIDIYKAHKIGGNNHFIQVRCGGMFLAAQTSKHEIYVWGSLHDRAPLCKSYCLSGDLNVLSFDCGINHIAMLTEDGSAYTAGYGSAGALGRKWTTREQFLSVGNVTAINEQCCQVACGASSTTFLTATGALYASGVSCEGIGYLGIQLEDALSQTPLRVNINESVLQIVANQARPSRYCALTVSNKIYTWGPSKFPKQFPLYNGPLHVLVAYIDQATPQSLGSLVEVKRTGALTNKPPTSSQSQIASNNLTPLIKSIVSDIVELQDQVQQLFITFKPLQDRYVSPATLPKQQTDGRGVKNSSVRRR